MISWRTIGGRFFRASSLQWAPTLTAHDPNPPINLEDPAGGGTAHTLNLSDTITLSDAVLKAVVKSHSDSVALSDSVSKSVGKVRTDTVTLVDAAIKTVGKTHSDTVTLSDARSTAVGKSLTDSITLSDLITGLVLGSGYTVSLSDTVTLTDNISVIVPPQPTFPPVFMGGGGTEIGHPRMKALKPERRDADEEDIEELEIVEILTCWLGKN